MEIIAAGRARSEGVVIGSNSGRQHPEAFCALVACQVGAASLAYRHTACSRSVIHVSSFAFGTVTLDHLSRTEGNLARVD